MINVESALNNFCEQFAWWPQIQNHAELSTYSKFLVAGMGGSHLAADILQLLNPKLDLIVHHNYGLPPLPDLKKRLIIISSYSGNTEEAIDAYHQALKKKLEVAVITGGGKLLKLARAGSQPYVELPQVGLEPRLALGYSLRALLALTAQNDLLKKSNQLSQTLKNASWQKLGRNWATKLKGSVPIIYSSLPNQALAYNWKIKFNETGKVPSFYNTFSELNHNEIEGVCGQGASSKHFYFLILEDRADDPRIKKRLRATAKIYQDSGLRVARIKLTGKNNLEKVFNSLLLADWISVYLAQDQGLDPMTVPKIEEFKKLISAQGESASS